MNNLFNNNENGNPIVNAICKLLPILAIVFVGFAAIAFVYYFIAAISVSSSYLGGFGDFVTIFANGLSAVMKYFFFAAITAAAHKLINK